MITKINEQSEKSELVRSCCHLRRPNGLIVGSKIAFILSEYPTLDSVIPTQGYGIDSIDGRIPFSNSDIKQFCHNFGLSLGVYWKKRIALCIPNGPKLALTR